MTTEITLRERDIALLHELEDAGVLTATSLNLADESMSYERWESLCRMFGSLRTRTSWWIGDLLNFGEGVYGERYAQGIEEFGLSYETLVKYAYVSRNVARRRRRTSLSFSHHALVAKLDPDEQERWLKLAASEGWSTRELGERVTAIESDGRASIPSENGGGGGTPTLTVGEAARQVWHAAQKDGDRYLVPLEPMELLAAKLGE